MIAFGSSITAPELYRECAERGINRVKEPDSQVLARMAAGSLFRSYNVLLDEAAQLDDLEALVLVHQDAEIIDGDFIGKLRRALSDPDVGVVGCVGAIGVRSIAWWEGSVTWASFTHRYGELGGGEIPAFSFAGEKLPPYAHTGEVDTVDGFILGLSPWTVQNVRFDESLGQLHGYDLDFCLSVRAAGKKVITEDFQAVHHHSLELVSEPDTWMTAHMKVAEKWEGRMGAIGFAPGDWKERARRAEAEAAATRAQVVAKELQHEAELKWLRLQIEVMKHSISWKLTSPLRWINKLRKDARQRRDGEPDEAPEHSRVPR
ncbi:MAG TPA: glycosyltransferase [Myxococcaceae bacterium]